MEESNLREEEFHEEIISGRRVKRYTCIKHPKIKALIRQIAEKYGITIEKANTIVDYPFHVWVNEVRNADHSKFENLKTLRLRYLGLFYPFYFKWYHMVTCANRRKDKNKVQNDTKQLQQEE